MGQIDKGIALGLIDEELAKVAFERRVSDRVTEILRRVSTRICGMKEDDEPRAAPLTSVSKTAVREEPEPSVAEPDEEEESDELTSPVQVGIVAFLKAQSDHEEWVSPKVIADGAGLNRNSVKSALALLKANLIVEHNGKEGKVSGWRLTFAERLPAVIQAAGAVRQPAAKPEAGSRRRPILPPLEDEEEDEDRDEEDADREDDEEEDREDDDDI
jgi:hypothetical protein